MPRFVVIGNPENRRISFFRDAVIRSGYDPPTEISYSDLLAGRKRIGDAITSGTILRIESPGENFDVEKALLQAGVDDAEAEGAPLLRPEEIDQLRLDPGLILHPRQWYLGFSRVLHGWAAEIAEHSDVRVMNAAQEIAVMFDKPACHRRLASDGIPVPTSFENVSCYEELVVRMLEADAQRVFIKLAHGSSASGVVAFQHSRHRQIAITSAELIRNGTIRLYNSLKMRRYTSARDIADLINTLCAERVHVERWMPKASLDGQSTFDLRVVVIGGDAWQFVVRQGKSPMTNLHLGNRRGDNDEVLRRLGRDGWQSVQETCSRVMHHFPGSLYAGLDVLITPGFINHTILEVNAFGDLLPGVLRDGKDSYTAEVESQLREPNSPSGYRPTI